MKKLSSIIIILAVLFVGKNASALSGCSIVYSDVGGQMTALECSNNKTGPGEYKLYENGVLVKTETSALENETRVVPQHSYGTNSFHFINDFKPILNISPGNGVMELKVNDVSQVCWTSTAGGYDDTWIVSNVGTCYSAPAPFQGSLGGTISLASNHIKTAVGFTPGSMVAWAGDNLIKLFIGSGLAVLFALRWWIVALVIIGAVVYFAYRAFQFFKR